MEQARFIGGSNRDRVRRLSLEVEIRASFDPNLIADNFKVRRVAAD